jgi:starch-binding outer membrane protein, SusD/RagB family
MNRIYLVFLAILMLVASSCKKSFIDLNPPSYLNSEGFYKTQADINEAVLAAYGNLRTVYVKPFVDLGEIRSDNTTYTWWFSNGASERGIDDFSAPLLPDNIISQNAWDGSYATIMRCNVVIDRVDGATFNSEALRKQYTAEAKFVRALMYFWLNRLYGHKDLAGNLSGAILVDHEITPAEAYKMKRASLQDNYDLIVNDLKYAELNLPATYNGNDKGRITKTGAKALLGKVYMTMAGYPLNKGNEYYNLAIAKFEEVVNDPQYGLVPNYKDLFDVNKKNSKESLFEIQYKKGSPANATGSPWPNSFAPRYSHNEVVAGDKLGENIPTPDMAKAYEYGDPRKYWSMRDGYIDATNGIWQASPYVCKYFDVNTGSMYDNGNNWIELRLADIYLLYAEAEVRTGANRSLAITYLNLIRQRARNTPGDPSIVRPANLLKDYQLSDFSNDQDFLLAIEKERRVELAFENHRWFDLVRTGRAKDVMIAEQAADGYGAFIWNDSRLAYPIPSSVMQSSPNQITQNEGYPQL